MSKACQSCYQSFESKYQGAIPLRREVIRVRAVRSKIHAVNITSIVRHIPVIRENEILIPYPDSRATVWPEALEAGERKFWKSFLN